MLLICCLVLGGYKECANKLDRLNFIENLVFVEVLRSRASKQAHASKR